MRKIVITGATSYIGLHLIRELIKNGNAKIYAVVRTRTNKINLLPKNDKITTVYADMHSYDTLDQQIKDSCDCLIHLAWKGTRGADRMNIEMQQQNYFHSMAAVHSALRIGVSSIITAGSGAEYGPHYDPITEDTPCIPNTEYGKQKLKFFYDASDLCNSKNIKLKEPRFFSLYGPGDFKDTMIISILINMLKNEDCLLTECVQLWDYLYIDDAIRGLIKLIETNVEGVFNFGSGIAKPLKEYVEEMHRITNSKSRLLFGAVPYPTTGMINLQPVVDKLMNETGWQPQISFREGITRTIAGINTMVN